MRVARPLIPAPKRHRQKDLGYIFLEGGNKTRGRDGGRERERESVRERKREREQLLPRPSNMNFPDYWPTLMSAPGPPTAIRMVRSWPGFQES